MYKEGTPEKEQRLAAHKASIAALRTLGPGGVAPPPRSMLGGAKSSPSSSPTSSAASLPPSPGSGLGPGATGIVFGLGMGGGASLRAPLASSNSGRKQSLYGAGDDGGDDGWEGGEGGEGMEGGEHSLTLSPSPRVTKYGGTGMRGGMGGGGMGGGGMGGGGMDGMGGRMMVEPVQREVLGVASPRLYGAMSVTASPSAGREGGRDGSSRTSPFKQTGAHLDLNLQALSRRGENEVGTNSAGSRSRSRSDESERWGEEVPDADFEADDEIPLNPGPTPRGEPALSPPAARKLDFAPPSAVQIGLEEEGEEEEGEGEEEEERGCVRDA